MIKKIGYGFKCNHKKKYKLGNVIDSAIPIECSTIIEKYPGLVIFIVSKKQSMLDIYKLIKYFTNVKIICLSDLKNLLSNQILFNENIISSYFSVLHQLHNMKKGLLIVSIPTLLEKICSYQYIIKYSLFIQKNDFINIKEFFYKIQKLGYQRVNKIVQPGDFVYSDSVIDIYPTRDLFFFRISFQKKDYLIIKLQKIYLYNQKTSTEIKYITLLAKNKFFPNKNIINLLNIDNIYKKKHKKIIPINEDFQLFFSNNELVTLFDYFPYNTLIIEQQTFKKELHYHWNSILQEYCAYSQIKDNNNDILEKMWISSQELLHTLDKYLRIKFIKEQILENNNAINLDYKNLPDLFHALNIQKKIDYLSSFLHSFSGTIIFSFLNKNDLQYSLDFLNKINIFPQYAKNILNINIKKKYLYIISNFTESFINTKKNLLLLCEQHLLPIINSNKNVCHSKIKTEQNIFQLKMNHPIIHFEHGIGRYQGLKTIETANIKSEYLVISYAGEDKLYVPIAYLYLVSPYIGIGQENAPLHKLGGTGWSKEKNKISHILYDHAAKLLDLYAHRASKKGFSFDKHENKYKIFCKDFPFSLTTDQKKVVKSIINDMHQSKPMDHLLCGDVGFGKTEVAMRAAFLSVANNKQVAVLVPTTLLAQQHYKNFTKRFSNWPTNIEILSRFETEKKQRQIIKNTQQGSIHILIGTHKLLFKKIKWCDLGLLIIDEEHRFGVQHKEKIQKSYPNIDVLTLTATPIPRTLNMAITGIKDLSVISSPPDTRMSIKTFVKEYDSLLVRNAILHEISRQGQVYYIYNKVKNINNIAINLSKLVPEAQIQVGHGKMYNHDLKKVMKDFYQKKFNVLVCTTIIESGIDIPNANTIIIENADHFGLSQLHQLRGRVGRSNNQAYAFLLINSFKHMTLDAKKRLESILSINNFGAGFFLSNQDLEIRGVGELLGKEQSGHIYHIGFSLYMKLLKNAVKLLKKGEHLSLNELIEKQPEIELYLPSFFSESYISNVNQRLYFYKRLSNAKTIHEIQEIKCSLIDQFGQLPNFSINLILISEMRILSKKVGICRIQANKNGGYIEFNKNNFINIKYLLSMFKKAPKIWKMESSTKLKFTYHLPDEVRINWIIVLLKNFEKNI